MSTILIMTSPQKFKEAVSGFLRLYIETVGFPPFVILALLRYQPQIIYYWLLIFLSPGLVRPRHGSEWVICLQGRVNHNHRRTYRVINATV